MRNTIERLIYNKMESKDFGESMCNETKLKVLRWVIQQLKQHGVSGKRPTPDIDKLLHDFAVECGYSDEFHLCAMSENISTEHMKQFALYYQAACASGGVDKTVSEGNALQKFLKEEKEIEKRDGKIFDE